MTLTLEDWMALGQKLRSDPGPIERYAALLERIKRLEDEAVMHRVSATWQTAVDRKQAHWEIGPDGRLDLRHTPEEHARSVAAAQDRWEATFLKES